MIAVTITLSGFEAIRARLGDQMRGKTLVAMDSAMKGLQSDMRYYPPRKNKRYVRTYRMQRNWLYEIHADASSVTGRLYNETSYVRWVQDRVRQTELHAATPWQTIQDVAVRRRKSILGVFSDSLFPDIRGVFSA